MMKSRAGFDSEWFNSKMSEAFKEITKKEDGTFEEYDPQQLEEYEKSLFDQPSSLFVDFSAAKGLKPLYKDSPLVGSYILNRFNNEILDVIFINKDKKFICKK